MHSVPSHVKQHVDRIIEEYENLCKSGFKVALQMYRNNQIYSGIETTQYCLNEVRNFRKLLNNPTGSMFVGSEMEVSKQIYNQIYKFYAPLSPEAIKRITCETKCQNQLMQTLHTAKQFPSLAEEAKHLLYFIKNGRTMSWNQTDENVQYKHFKLVKSESAFTKLFSDSPCPAIEITSSGSFPHSQIRIALQIFDIESIYRKQAKMREYKNFWESAHNIDEFDFDYNVFNLWNNVATTGVYYVYIPELYS